MTLPCCHGARLWRALCDRSFERIGGLERRQLGGGMTCGNFSWQSDSDADAKLLLHRKLLLLAAVAGVEETAAAAVLIRAPCFLFIATTGAVSFQWEKQAAGVATADRVM